MLIELFLYTAKNGVTYKRARVSYDQCGKITERIPAAAKRPKFHACSKRCADLSNNKGGKTRKHVEKTCFEKFGASSPAESLTVKQKITDTNNVKYGTSWSGASKQVHDKIKQTIIDKYGVDNIAKLQETKDKINTRSVRC